MRRFAYPATTIINHGRPVREERIGGREVPIYRGIPASLARYYRAQGRRMKSMEALRQRELGLLKESRDEVQIRDIHESES